MFKFADRMQGLSGNAIREIFKLLANPEIISFAGGMPADAAFPCGDVARITEKLMADKGSVILQYGATEGYAPLRESTAEYLLDCGITAKPDDILPVTGSQQAIDLLCKAMINPGDRIIVESPTFLGALHTMRTYQADIKPAPMDENGVIPDALEEAIKAHSPKFIYLIPTFQNPTGITLSAERRSRIAGIAAKYGVVVLEDDPYRDLRYYGEPLPAIKSFDTEGYVVYSLSYSKVISPGLRVGAVVAHPDLLRKMTIGKQAADVHTPILTQAIVDAYLREGLLPGAVSRAREGYRAQLDAMLAQFSEFPDGTTHTSPAGGLFVWAELPRGMDTTALLPKACESLVAYVPGTGFYCAGGNENTMRLNFSKNSPEKIITGMKALARVLNG